MAQQPFPGPFTSAKPVQLPEVPLPFPLRYSPYEKEVDDLTRRWCLTTGILPDTEAAGQWWETSALTAILAWCMPDASAERLLLCNKWVCLAFLFDDQFDNTSLGWRLADTQPVLDQMIAALELAPSHPVARLQPFSYAWADLLADFSQCMSPVWMRRQRHYLARWWRGIAQAVAHRDSGAPPLDFRERYAIRRLTVGMESFGELLEVASGWELPPTLDAMREIRRVRHLITDITLFQNDMCSLERERQGGNDDNVLLGWEAEGHSTAAAVDMAQDQIRTLADEFQTLLLELPRLADRLGLSPADREGFRRWIGICSLYLAGAGRCQASGDRYTRIMTEAAHDHHLDRLLHGWS
ncbi:hypothetical protein ACFQ71_36085 [Streptomyces sp. NPDC056534]|uniref:terpene synthase family protein n=1 Tax=Streptomyces sp. NPDC056534 TaxID=3345857 RepID=UPI003685F4CA